MIERSSESESKLNLPDSVSQFSMAAELQKNALESMHKSQLDISIEDRPSDKMALDNFENNTMNSDLYINTDVSFDLEFSRIQNMPHETRATKNYECSTEVPRKDIKTLK